MTSHCPGRRTLLATTLAALVATALRPLRALAEWNGRAFSAATLDTALAETFAGRAITDSTRVRIDMPDLVENGAVVPVQVDADLQEVSSVSIFAELNPNPLIARFHLAPGCLPGVATRIKVAAPSHVIAVVETPDGLFSARRFVEVVDGGCG